jgi:acetoacetyl-CoA synthetase
MYATGPCRGNLPLLVPWDGRPQIGREMPEPQPIWVPTQEEIDATALTSFARQLGLPSEYGALQKWSVDHLDEFWRTLAEHYGVAGDLSIVREGDEHHTVRWFPEVTLNYARSIFDGKSEDSIALVHASESESTDQWTWGRLRVETARVRSGLLDLGVGPGDTVAAYMPNLPETIAAFLAVASLGATFSSAAPEFGSRAVTDRFSQLQPKVLLGADGYRYNGREYERIDELTTIHQAVGGSLVRFSYLGRQGWPADFGDTDRHLTFVEVPFDHPLWVLFSSGTTGLPKPITHGHGGMLLEHLKYAHLHLDARPTDRVFWYTTTGWMMWNFLVGVLLTDAAVVLYDGAPNREALWDLAQDAGVTIFGTSAAFLAGAAKVDDDPRNGRDLAIRAVGSTGSPLSPEAFRWVYDRLGERTWLFSMSGGTDVCSAFLAGVPTLPVYEGELQAAALGADVQAWDASGHALIDRVGELVLAQPMPCMPVGFWGDPTGERYQRAYFEHFPGTWRHGDFVTLTSRGTAIIHGRSDATINRGGVRMGTAEIYSAALMEPEVMDALVVDVTRGGDHWLPLFVVLRDGDGLDDELTRRIATRIRTDCSPRHVPDEILAVPAVPRTLSGKVLEVPVKRILAGEHPRDVVDQDALLNPDALDPFIQLADERQPRADR